MHHFQAQAGVFYGLGVGPGDPLLITLKAHQLIQCADVICYLANQIGTSQARDIAQHSIDSRNEPAKEVAIPMPMSTDRTAANAAYDLGAQQIAEQLKLGKSVVFLCEGDPLFFGSFSYLLERLSDAHECLVVPGISSVNGAASALKQPLTLLQESFVIMSGRHTDQQLTQALNNHDNVVIMKAGRARPRILALLHQTGRTEDANYLAYIGRENQQILTDVSRLANEEGPYFSLFVVLNKERNS
ncbi:MAG: precorrin-2 C(20)-methyltransferase [Gammaproteobacteria bacterium]|nr:precorrin-2 C(20)-methyltransferase [Gammaproteobacteria bacterium]